MLNLSFSLRKKIYISVFALFNFTTFRGIEQENGPQTLPRAVKLYFIFCRRFCLHFTASYSSSYSNRHSIFFGCVQPVINTAVSRNKDGKRYQEADVVSVIDDRHVVPVGQQSLAPQHAEQRVRKKRGEHGDARLAQAFKSADVNLVQRIEEIEREGPVNSGNGVGVCRRIFGEEPDQRFRQNH